MYSAPAYLFFSINDFWDVSLIIRNPSSRRETGSPTGLPSRPYKMQRFLIRPRNQQPRLALLGLTCVGLLGGGTALAEEKKSGYNKEEADHSIVVGVGGAAELELADGSVHPGGNVFVEWVAIESWLELEVGVSAQRSEGGPQLPVDLLFKKPFRIARWAEFMVGAGPEVVTTVAGANKGTHVGGEVALDLMFWTWHRVGFWVEPSYDFVLQNGVSHGVGSTGGIMLSWYP